MRKSRNFSKKGSVLLTAILTLTILSMICALSLYVTSQNVNATSQTASWQTALSGAESGVEQAYHALNKSNWTGWQTVSGSLPTTQPTGGTSTISAPTSGQYIYLSRTVQVVGEGSSTVKFWATIDTAGLPLDSNGNQWYRIRATGLVAAPGPARVSNQKRDNDLRKVSLRTDRISGLALTTPQAARMIEVIAKPNMTNIWSRGITLSKYLQMNGTGEIDSFDSSSGLYSTNHLYDRTRRKTNGNIGIVDSTSSDLKNDFVGGNITYSGPAIKNTKGVTGNISTPFSTTIPLTSDPSWTSGTYTSYASGSVPATITAGSSVLPTLIKVNGDFKLTGNSTFKIAAPSGAGTSNAAIIWVTGSFSTGGTSQIIQDPNIEVTWYVDKDITVNGTSYPNQDGYASSVNFIGVGTNNNATIIGTGDFIGTMNIPGYTVKIGGNGSFVGAVIGKTLEVQGTSGVHYDEALGKTGSGGAIDNYSYASWFENNAQVSRNIIY